MDLDPKELRRTPDGETLLRLDSGIEIVRRRKHEPIGISGATRASGLCVRLDGRYAHAYPVDETEL